MTERILEALNKQIQHELFAGYNYLGLSIYFDQESLPGLSTYMKRQAVEEYEHASRLLEYVQDRGGVATLLPLDAPKLDFATPLEALRHAQSLERANTAAIHAIYKLSRELEDPATEQAMLWFIDEQVEEEKWCDDFVSQAERVAEHPGAMFMFDHSVARMNAQSQH